MGVEYRHSLYLPQRDDRPDADTVAAWLKQLYTGGYLRGPFALASEGVRNTYLNPTNWAEALTLLEERWPEGLRMSWDFQGELPERYPMNRRWAGHPETPGNYEVHLISTPEPADDWLSFEPEVRSPCFSFTVDCGKCVPKEGKTPIGFAPAFFLLAQRHLGRDLAQVGEVY